MTDVVVVGGSIAGASTAVYLARLGLSVHLIERSQFPRRKACGEGLFQRGVEALDDLGVLDTVLGQAQVLDSLRVEVDGVSVEGRLPPHEQPAIGVQRSVLDSALLDQARRCGVEVSLGVTAIDLLPSHAGYRGVRTNCGDYSCKAIVVADGIGSRLRRIAGLAQRTSGHRYGVSAHYAATDEVKASILIKMFRGHEIYVTPVLPRLVNVALLLGKGQARKLSGNLGAAFDRLVQESNVLPEGGTLTSTPLAVGPFPSVARHDWTGNLILVGDAAGFFDGISGEGMSLALVTSKLAAHAVQEFLRTGNSDAFVSYEKTRRGLSRNSGLLARVSLLLAAHPALGRGVIGNLSKNPATFEKIVAINSGVAGLSALRPGDLRSLLFGL